MSVQTITLPMKDMSCPSCSAAVEKLVDTLDGMQSRIISHESDSGEFTFDTSVLSEEKLISKINEGHYKVLLPMKTITLPINGMSCPSCSAAVERLVDTLDGLESRTISYESDSGEFTFDPNIIDESTLVAKINEGHYKVDSAYVPIFTFEAVVPACPTCGNKGQLVPNTVFRSNVKGDSFKKINTETDNYICMDSDCDVAYYNAENENVILKDELKRELWYKKGIKRVIACYCNNVDTEQVKDAIVNHNLSDWDDVMGFYRAKVIEKCETLNPTGFCCRSTYKGLVKEIKDELVETK